MPHADTTPYTRYVAPSDASSTAAAADEAGA